MKQQEIVNYCDHFLNISDFQDYCPNGTQVEGDGREAKKISLGVSITLELIEKAVENQSDLIITHHGLFWNKDERIIKGPLKNRLKLLLETGTAAAAYHLPLDFHPEIGNNIQLAIKLGLKNPKGFAPMGQYFQGIIGSPETTDVRNFHSQVEKTLQRECFLIARGKDKISRTAIMTGAAQGAMVKALEAGADCFVTGEVSESVWSLSKEHGINFISAGHYTTEKFGIRALGACLREKFDVEVEFIDLFNPI